MIDFATIEPALIAWWTGFGMQTQKRDAPRDFTRPATLNPDPNVVTGATAFLKVTGVLAKGIDEIRYTVNADNAERGDTEVTGNREITVQCMVESYEDTPNQHAVNLCERARTRLRNPTVEAALQVAGIGVIEAGPTLDLPYETDGRVFSHAAFELRANVNASDIEIAGPNSGFTIAIVLVTSDYKGVDGNSLPANQQLVNKAIDSTI